MWRNNWFVSVFISNMYHSRIEYATHTILQTQEILPRKYICSLLHGTPNSNTLVRGWRKISTTTFYVEA